MPEPGDAERVAPSALLRDERAVAVLRAPDAAAYDAVADVLVEQGILSIELTLTTPGTLQAVGRLVDRYAGRAEIGVGTVLSAVEAEAVLDAGAAFLVTPTVRPDVVAAAVRAGRPVYPGGMTPTEVAANWTAGASAVKLFPASLVAPDFLSALRGPFPHLLAMPSGGVTFESVPAWFAAGAIAVSLGGELVGDAFRGGDLRDLDARARDIRAMIDAAR